MSRDRLVGLCCMVIGLLISIGSIRLGIGNFSAPQAGMFPFLVGLVIILLAIIISISSKAGKTGKETPILGARKKALFLVFGSLIFFTLVFEWLGFTVTVLLWMVIILKVIEPQKWKTTLIISVFSTLFIYLIFILWLKIEFPKGIFGL